MTKLLVFAGSTRQLSFNRRLANAAREGKAKREELSGSTMTITSLGALGGIVTTLALTRTHAPVGRLYAADLLGAAIGCLAAVVLLDTTNLSAAAFAATAVDAGDVARVAGRAEERVDGGDAASELVRVGLAEHHGAGHRDARHRIGIRLRHVVFVEP